MSAVIVLLWLALAQDPAVDDLIKQLGSDDADTREAATKALIDLGEDAFPKVKAALEKATDEEVRVRLNLVAEAIDPRGAIRVPDGEIRGRFLFSPDGKRVAYESGSHVNGNAVYLAERKGRERLEGCDSIANVVFSPDGKFVAHVAVGCVIVDGKKGAAYDGIGIPVFSPDGKSIAYRADSRIIVGDKPGEKYDEVGDPAWSPDGKAVAYAARKGDKWRAVVGDKAGEEYDYVGPPSWSPDGQAVAYPVKHGGKGFVVYGGNKSKEYDGVDAPVFSPDGKAVAFIARSGDKRCVVAGDMGGEAFQWIGGLAWTPDGKDVVYRASENDGRTWCVVAGAKKSDAFEILMGPAVASGGAVAYAARDRRGKWIVRAGEAQSEDLDGVTAPVVMPDGKSVGFGTWTLDEFRWRTLDFK